LTLQVEEKLNDFFSILLAAKIAPFSVMILLDHHNSFQFVLKSIFV